MTQNKDTAKKDVSTKKKAESKPAQTPEYKDIILYLAETGPRIIEQQLRAVQDLKKITDKNYTYALLIDSKQVLPKAIEKKIPLVIRTNTKRINKVEEALAPYEHRIAAIMNRLEFFMPAYMRIIELFPYLKHPVIKSLKIANDKIEMRHTLKKYTPDIIPKYDIVKKASDATVKKIEQEIGFPCVIKPASLSQSKLITVCYYREELKKTLEETFKKIQAIYKEGKVEHEPKVLVEQLLEGHMYSIDAYVDGKGKIYYTPPIEIKTGRDIGYDDFFMYTQMTPTNLDGEELEALQATATRAIHAFGIRYSTAHVELYKTKTGFKIIEIGSRVGGFRNELLEYAFGIRHYLNDILIKLAHAPKLKPTKKKHSVLLKMWPRETGILSSVKGFKKIIEETFVVEARQQMKPGDKISPARFGTPPTVLFYLVGDTREKLLGHIRKVEKAIDIIIE